MIVNIFSFFHLLFFIHLPSLLICLFLCIILFMELIHRTHLHSHPSSLNCTVQGTSLESCGLHAPYAEGMGLTLGWETYILRVIQHDRNK